MRIVQCPYDSRPAAGNRRLIWVQEKESCDFCYNARSPINGGVPCCDDYSGDGGRTTSPIGGGYDGVDITTPGSRTTWPVGTGR